MDSINLIEAFEAVLFSAGEPISIDRFATVFELDIDKVIATLEQLDEKIKNSQSGIELVKLENTYQLCSKSQYGMYIRKMADIRRKTPLSQAAMEILAVVAYNQPVTKSFIEQVRGVDCSSTIGTLIEKGLLEEKGRLELPGKPLLYGTTKNFLRSFGISNLKELPELPHDENGTRQPDIGEQLSVDGVLEEENVEKEE